MWDKVVTYFKAVFFQGWFWVDKTKEYEKALSLIVVIVVLVIVLFALAKFGFLKKSK
jgi:membrane protein DedA with SNARE-associated domain